jgi:hypothetical protein
MLDEPCQWREKRAGEMAEDINLCGGIPVDPASKARLTEMYHFSKYCFGLETCTTNTKINEDTQLWNPMRQSMQNGIRHGGYSEAYQIPPEAGGRGMIKPSSYVAIHAVANLHRTMHGDYQSAQLLRAYWNWIQTHTKLAIWEQLDITLEGVLPDFLFASRIQQALNQLRVTMKPTFCAHNFQQNLTAEASMLRIPQLPPTWKRVTAATDGGLTHGQATIGMVAFRVHEGRFIHTGPEAAWEWASRLQGPEQQVYMAETEAVETLLHAAPPYARVDIWMDALARMKIIIRFHTISHRRRLKIPGCSSLRRIEMLRRKAFKTHTHMSRRTKTNDMELKN